MKIWMIITPFYLQGGAPQRHGKVGKIQQTHANTHRLAQLCASLLWQMKYSAASYKNVESWRKEKKGQLWLHFHPNPRQRWRNLSESHLNATLSRTVALMRAEITHPKSASFHCLKLSTRSTLTAFTLISEIAHANSRTHSSLVEVLTDQLSGVFDTFVERLRALLSPIQSAHPKCSLPRVVHSPAPP